jgi:hypothetical protein
MMATPYMTGVSFVYAPFHKFQRSGSIPHRGKSIPTVDTFLNYAKLVSEEYSMPMQEGLMEEKVNYTYEYEGGFGTYRTTGTRPVHQLPLVGDNVAMKVDEMGFDSVLKVKSRLFEYDVTGLLTVTLRLSHTVY